MSPFAAHFPGRCGKCGEVFDIGTNVFYTTPDDILLGWDCCGASDEPDAASMVTPPDRVMPRGKTARDACGRCWQIPATNGACGCDS